MLLEREMNSTSPEGLIDIKRMTKRRRCDDNWVLSCLMAACIVGGLLLAVLWVPAA